MIAGVHALSLTAQINYYVDATSGSDGNKGVSPSDAWKTLEHVSEQKFVPGDRILLKKGETFNTILTVSNSGTSEQPIVISSYGEYGPNPIIDILDKRIPAGIRLDDVAHVHVENMEVTGNSKYGIWIRAGSYHVIQDCYVHHISMDTERHGILLSEYPLGTKILNNEISYCGAEGIYGSSVDIEIGYNYIHNIDLVGTVGDCIQLNTVSPGFHVHHNVLDHSNSNSSKGVFISSDYSDSVNGIFEHNVCYGGKGDDFGFTCTGLGNIVRYNKFYAAEQVGFAIKGRVLAHHNIIEGYGSGMSCVSEGDEYEYYNNLLIDVGYNCYVQNNGNKIEIVFKNNISTNSRFRDFDNVTYNSSHNIYTSGSTVEKNSRIVNPLFKSEKDFHLNPGSPAIGKGIFIPGLEKDFDGVEINNPPSIGPYEFVIGINDDKNKENSPPIIVLNYETSIAGGKTTELLASASYDVDGDSLSYQWILPELFEANSTTLPNLKILPPMVKTVTQYTIVLHVSAGKHVETRRVNVVVYPYNDESIEIPIKSIEAKLYQQPNYPENILDENLDTYWSAQGDNAWISFELEDKYYLSHLNIAFFKGEKREAFFELHASNDNSTWESLSPKTGSCGFAKKEQLFTANLKSQKKYKYVKLVGHCNSENEWNAISELKIFGAKDVNMLGSKGNTTIIANLHPNPASNFLFLDIKEDAKVKLFSWSGMLVYNNELRKGQHRLEVDKYDAGVYYLQVTPDKNPVETQRIVLL